MLRFRCAIVVVPLGLVLCGCLATPQLASPGSAERQQGRAQLFEPYPEPDIGPKVAGARPCAVAPPVTPGPR